MNKKMKLNKRNRYCPPCGDYARWHCRRCGRLFCWDHIGDHVCRPSNHHVAAWLVEHDLLLTGLQVSRAQFRRRMAWALSGVAAANAIGLLVLWLR